MCQSFTFSATVNPVIYLKAIPVDFLKIDGSFIREINEDQTDRAFVESINQIGNLMGLQTIAEFVENKNILNTLKEIGVDFAQGYFLGKPVLLDEALNHESFNEQRIACSEN